MFPGFRFLPYSIFENPETTENFYLFDFEHFRKHLVCLRQNSQGVAQSYQEALTTEA